MRKLTGAVFQSLDSVIQGPGGPNEDPTGGFRFGGWVAPHWDEEMGPFERLIMSDYDLLLGRRTYDIFAAYWPYNRDNPIGEKFQRINKYVLTRSDEPLEWENSIKLEGDTAQTIAELKTGDGRDFLIQGSSTLYSALLSARLIDRLMLITFPIVLGKGKRLFDGSEEASRLELVDHFVSSRGVVITTYEPAGDVPTGTFETKAPSEAELDRRRNIEAGSW
jgi:dihydrofolate reductase